LGSDLLAAPVLAAAAARPTLVGAVVSIGGRPDLASEHLARVEASTLLLVGDQDVPAIGLSEFALDRLSSPKRLDLIPGAGSLYDDPAALEAAGRRARDWFTAHLLPVGA
jgi:putative phosphoribosyl transferase